MYGQPNKILVWAFIIILLIAACVVPMLVLPQSVGAF